MKISKIEISNFRSIKYAEIEFNHNCLILVGKNEAGKSNVLKAIAALFGEYIPEDKDRRKRIGSEKIEDEEYYISANFYYDTNDLSKIENKLKSKFNNLNGIRFANNNNLNTLIVKMLESIFIEIKIKENSKPNLNYKDFIIENFTPINYYIYGNNISEKMIPQSKAFDLKHEIYLVIEEHYNHHSFSCKFIKNSSNLIIPNLIGIEEFKSNPNKYMLLKNLFVICGRDNIKKTFEEALSEDGDYINLFNQISTVSTEIVKEIWGDFKETSIELGPNGPDFYIKIKNTSMYNYEDRSDGFKKFLSILLLISSEARTGKINENCLVLIDEPDNSLYPTSTVQLRNELLNISHKVRIIYSTHSQYMLDDQNLDRHIEVKKEGDITSLVRHNGKSPYVKDELLRHLIGASVFENIQSKNIIFEGYLDRELFLRYCEFSNKTSEFDTYGKIYSTGVSGFNCLVSILESANKKFVIVADSDRASNEQKEKFNDNHTKFSANWLAYGDIIDKITTMEDFFKSEYLEEVLKIDYPGFTLDRNTSNLNNIDRCVNNKEKTRSIKNTLVQKMKKEDVIEDYIIFIDELKKKLEAI